MLNAKSISLATALEKSKLASDIPFLVCLDVAVIDPTTRATVETLRIVKNTEDITWNGNVYTAAAFDLELKEESGSQPEITLTVTDYTKTIMQRLEAYGGGVGFGVVVSIVRGDTNTMASDAPEIQAFFEITGTSAQDYVISFQLGASNPLAKIFPRRVQTKNFCTWRYKDPTTCKYAGAMGSCDLTLNGPNGCKQHANAINYGGFPGINNANTRAV